MKRVGQHSLQPRFWFGEVDNRPVALFRIAFGLVLLKDAIYHLFLAETFYSAAGVYPAGGPFTLWPPADFSFFHLNDSPEWALTLFALWIIVLIALVLGWQSRWAALANWLLLVSVQERNPLVLSGADVVMSVMSFWLLFLPLAEHYALDTRRRGGGRRYSYALPVRLAQLQICFVYLQTALLKIPGGAWFDGRALHYAFHQTYLTSPVTDWLMQWLPVWLLVAAGLAVWLVEISFTFWMLAPFGQPKIRWVALIAGYALHLGIVLTMAVQDFPWVMMASYFLFWEGSWVARLVGWLPFSSRQTDSMAQEPLTGRERAGRLVLTAGLLYVAFGVLWLLARGTIGEPVPPVRGFTGQLLRGAGLAQRWTMFTYGTAPGQDVWVVVAGHDAEGQMVDLERGGPTPVAERRWLWGPAVRFRKYEELLPEAADAAAAWAAHHCQGTESPEQVTVQFWRREINEIGDPAGIYKAPTMTILHEQDCHP